MVITRLLLQQFRSYPTADFSFSESLTFIVGANTAGKSNIVEAVSLLSRGKSFRTERDEQMVQFGNEIARVKARITNQPDAEQLQLEVVLAQPAATGKSFLTKKFLVNNVPKRRVDFAGRLPTLLFDPTDLDIVSGSPSLRRDFLDEVLEQTDRGYRLALLTYTKALRQRNALLQLAKETGVRNEGQFSYWDEIVITNGNTVSAKRQEFVSWCNEQQKVLFPLFLVYDHSFISEERLLQYRDAEKGSGVTLVGPHRDDILFFMNSKNTQDDIEVKYFGSRGQQRLAVVQLKLLQLFYFREFLQHKPVLLLDDIFSELDEMHIAHVLSVIGTQQTIITTTHKEFIPQSLTNANVIELSHADV